jgi:hypothetical protein
VSWLRAAARVVLVPLPVRLGAVDLAAVGLGLSLVCWEGGLMLTVSAVRMLKGVPLAVVVLLRLAQEDGSGPVNQEWLERYSGYTDKPVSQALRYLLEMGEVTRNDRGMWQLAGETRQLPLAAERLDERVGNIPTHPSSSSSGLIDSILDGSTTSHESEIFRLNLAALDAAGIREPARSDLARLAHVTPELVQAHVRECGSLGLAIYRIKNDWKPKHTPMATRNVIEEEEEAAPLPEPAAEVEDAGWRAVMGQLAEECSRGFWDTWVRDVRLVGVDGGVYTVGCVNQYGRDLLEARLSSTIARLLTGFTGMECKVVFVVGI